MHKQAKSRTEPKAGDIQGMPACDTGVALTGNGNLEHAAYITFQTVAIAMLLLSLLLLVAFVKTKQTRTNTSNLLITCLSVTDFLFGLLHTVTFTLYHIVDNDSAKCASKRFVSTCSGFLSYLSASIIVIMAADRYIHMNPNIERPSRFAKVFQRPKLYVLLTAVTVFCFAYAAAYELASQDSHFLAVYMLTCGTFTALVIFSVTFFYLRGYLRIRKFAANNPVYANANGSVSTPDYVKRLHKTIMLLLGSLYISCIPMLICTCIFSACRLDGKTDLLLQMEDSFLIASPVFLSSRVFGPIIILCCNNKASSWVTRQFKRLACCALDRRPVAVVAKQASRQESRGSGNRQGERAQSTDDDDVKA